jgi:hypothetical protein
MNNDYNNAPVFLASQILTNSAGGDLMTVLSTAASRVQILSVSAQAFSTSTSLVPLGMTAEVFRSSTSVGAGGATITPINAGGHSGAKAAVSAVLGPPSAGNSTAASERLFAGGFEADNGRLLWEPDFPVTMAVSDVLIVRAGTPVGSTGVTIAMTLTFREIGKMPI